MKIHLLTSRRQTVTRLFPNRQTNRYIVAAPPKAFGSVAGVQLIPNSEFTTNTVGWAATANGTLVWSGTSPTWMEVRAIADGTPTRGWIEIAVVPNTDLILEARYRHRTSNGSTRATARLANGLGTGTVIAGTTVFGSASTTWVTHSVTFQSAAATVCIAGELQNSITAGQGSEFDYIRLTGQLPPVAAQLPGP